MIVDTFMFYNEFDVLEMRLEVLDPYVDRFVLVEAEVNHVGGPKELFFEKNKDRYAKWLHKIKHIIVTAEESPKDTNPWSREKYQRDCIMRGLEGVPSDALVMISDVDEIPDMRMLRWEHLPHAAISVHMWMYQYNFKYLFTAEPWFGTVITQKELVAKYGPNYFRDNRWKFPPVMFAGWHLTSFGDEKHVLNKLKTFAHALDDNAHRHYQNLENVKQWIESGKHVDGKISLMERPSDASLPPIPDELAKKYM